MNKDEVLKLANLARIEIPESEAEALASEFGAILGYVGEIKNAKLEETADGEKPMLRNVLREDDGAHEPGIHTEALLAAAPSREGQFVKVKKIL